jgi:hypothetical protein
MIIAAAQQRLSQDHATLDNSAIQSLKGWIEANQQILLAKQNAGWTDAKFEDQLVKFAKAIHKINGGPRLLTSQHLAAPLTNAAQSLAADDPCCSFG